MRPQSVERFELLFLMSLGLGVVMAALNFDQVAATAGAGFVLIVTATTLLVMVGLVLWASRKGSNIARWILLVFAVLGAVAYVPTVPQLWAENLILPLVSAVQILLQVAGIYFVFRPDAKPWFQKTAA